MSVSYKSNKRIRLTYARFYELALTRDSRVIPGLTVASALSTSNLGLNWDQVNESYTFLLNTCMDTNMQFTINSFSNFPWQNFFPHNSLIFPWFSVKSLTFPWQLSNSLTFPGFPDKWSPGSWLRRSRPWCWPWELHWQWHHPQTRGPTTSAKVKLKV